MLLRPALFSAACALAVPMTVLADPAPAPGAKPSLAISSLEAEVGINPSLANLISDNMVATVRRTQVFSRVVSSRDMEAILSFDRQKQLLACSEDGCVAELAGALGVDFIIVGNLGRVGSSYLFNAKLINVRNGLSASTISERVKSEDALLDGMAMFIQQLLVDAGLLNKQAAALSATSGGASAPAGDGSKSGTLGLVLKGGALAILAGGVVLSGLGVLGIVAGVVVSLLPILLYVPPSLVGGYQNKLIVFSGGGTLLGVVGTAVAVVALLVTAVGGAGGVYAFFLSE